MAVASLDKVRELIKEKSSTVEALNSEIQELKKVRGELEKLEQEAHFLKPEPGDFWHDCFSPVLIVLESSEESVTICDRTKTVYEEPDPAMVLKSYENPDDPEVRKYFAKPRKETGYAFDVKLARVVSRSEFDSMLKCYGGDMKDNLTYRCVPRSAERFVELWRALTPTSK